MTPSEATTRAGVRRCEWAGTDPAMVAYHDEEWGSPSHDDRHLFEMLTLEGAQAGLSWSTILRKREGYRRAFAGFDVEAIARFDDRRIESLIGDPSIVRNRAKIESTIANARATLEVVSELGSLDALLWRFAEQPSGRARPTSLAEIPAETSESKAMSKELRRRGFRFVGPTICYALMQAIGIVDDHVAGCFRADRPESVVPRA